MKVFSVTFDSRWDTRDIYNIYFAKYIFKIVFLEQNEEKKPLQHHSGKKPLTQTTER